jgi:glucose-6-phosphate isomerase
MDAMFRGERINLTEKRAVLHTALRAPKAERIVVDGYDVVPEVHAVLDRMAAFADRVRSGDWRRYTRKRMRNAVNVGIGGSDLGPEMAHEALRHDSTRDLTFRLVSNVDGTDFAEATRDPDPQETLFVICSKIFTTLETLTNAHTARAWSLHRRAGRRHAFRCRLDQPGSGDEVRHRHREHVRFLGQGRGTCAEAAGSLRRHPAGSSSRIGVFDVGELETTAASNR